jgi:hypothetical protein
MDATSLHNCMSQITLDRVIAVVRDAFLDSSAVVSA